MAVTKRFGRRGFLALTAASAVAQTTQQPSGVMGGAVGGIATNTAWFSGPVGPASPGGITGQPYSAEQTTEQVQTLADGTHITHGVQKTMLYRDSAGRTRTEHIFQPPPGAVMSPNVPRMINIMDPVAGYHYFLNANQHTATRMAWPPGGNGANRVASAAITFNAPSAPSGANAPQIAPAPPPPPPPPPLQARVPSGPHPEMQREPLGTETIEGLVANGTRITTTYPEGSFGNDRPITVVSENWFSPELKMMVLSKSNDPRTGETTTRLTNVSQSEPDPSLFQVPADYTIIDQQQQQQ